ncbi:hypothetical protein G0029_17860 (plasmid) [Acinetobacter sp. YH12138]|uniref:hypothetical protein n=1 Tax=Acinetobacter sp. YH12138 TaxID=2601122 RepID=UPI0015D20C94|nr:hypothetical protein [Acinetobacter sp. YH12138]QOW51631.1 hypothetical protein G0029_17860 [Acinetobacter sp. YH12138]
MTNAVNQTEANEYAQFLAWKKQMAEEQALTVAKSQEQEALAAIDQGQLKIEDLVEPNEDFEKLNSKKVELAKLCGFELTDSKQALVATMFSFAQCLAADQRTTVMLKTEDALANDFMHIYGSWAYRTTMHKKLNSMEACMTANAMPYYNTLGTTYDVELKEHFRTQAEELKRGSQYVVAPKSVAQFTTASKDFIGSFTVDINKTTAEDLDWSENTKQLNRLRNEIDSDQFDLISDLRELIKARIPLMTKLYNICENDADFKKYALILAVATFLDLESFNVIKDAILEMANKVENGNIELFKASLTVAVEKYKSWNQENISIHTLADLITDTDFGEIGIGRLNTFLSKIDLKTDSVRCMNIPTQGLAIAEIEQKLAA